MLKNIQDLGTPLSKQQQQQVNGGVAGMPCRTNADCWRNHPFLGPGDVSCRSDFWIPGRRVCIFN